MRTELTAQRNRFLSAGKKLSDVLDAQTSDLLHAIEQVVSTIDFVLPENTTDSPREIDSHRGAKLGIAGFISLVAAAATPTSLPDKIITLNSACNTIGVTAVSTYKALDKYSTVQQEINIMRDYNGLSLMMLPPFIANKLPRIGGFIQKSKLGYNLTAAWFCATTSGMVGPVTRLIGNRLHAEAEGQGICGFIGSQFMARIGSPLMRLCFPHRTPLANPQGAI